MPGPNRSDALDHVVVIIFENRSLDNLLGRLYQPGEVASFDGVSGRDLSNPVPEWAAGAAGQKVVPYGVAADMNSPSPDPGEEYRHVNTQLFGLIDPPGNRGILAEKMTAPYNAPAGPWRQPAMGGFVADYISAFTAEMGRPPAPGEYAQIMTGYTPEQVPVLSALARGFATFDHWFCEVPSQTFANRSFFHAGTSSGYVVNMSPAGSFPVHNTAETILERLESNGLTWRVYCDPPSRISLTGIIHAPRLLDRFATHFFTTDQFLQDAAGGDLPSYSFIEPNLLYGHNDMHPALDALFPGTALDPPSALLGGEALLAKIYTAVRSASSPRGSNACNTLLMVTFDEHGGTYDHVPPPPGSAARPGRASRPDGLRLRPVGRARGGHRHFRLDTAADRDQRRIPPHLRHQDHP
jgi:phospholipase C